MVLRLLAFNAEAWLADRLNTYLADNNEYRATLRHLLHVGGQITYTTNTITVALDTPTTPKITRALRLLLDELSDHRYPTSPVTTDPSPTRSEQPDRPQLRPSPQFRRSGTRWHRGPPARRRSPHAGVARAAPATSGDPASAGGTARDRPAAGGSPARHAPGWRPGRRRGTQRRLQQRAVGGEALVHPGRRRPGHRRPRRAASRPMSAARPASPRTSEDHRHMSA